MASPEGRAQPGLQPALAGERDRARARSRDSADRAPRRARESRRSAASWSGARSGGTAGRACRTMARPPSADNRRSAEGRCRSSRLVRSSPRRDRLAFRHHVGLRQPLAFVGDGLAVTPRRRQRGADARGCLGVGQRAGDQAQLAPPWCGCSRARPRPVGALRTRPRCRLWSSSRAPAGRRNSARRRCRRRTPSWSRPTRLRQDRRPVPPGQPCRRWRVAAQPGAWRPAAGQEGSPPLPA